MSYQEKKTIANLVAGILVLIAYCVHAISKYQAGTVGPDDLKSWAGIMLIFTGIGIAVAIVMNIVFHIILAVMGEIRKEKTIDEREDEMDKLISLKSLRIGYAVGGAGFIASLLSLVLNCPAAVMINILFLSFGMASLVEGFLRLYFYRKGVRNG
jgi:hypothetical protein